MPHDPNHQPDTDYRDGNRSRPRGISSVVGRSNTDAASRTRCSKQAAHGHQYPEILDRPILHEAGGPRATIRGVPQGKEIEKHFSQVDESVHGPEMDKMLSDLRQLRVASGVEELSGVISSHTVTFNPRISSAIYSDDLLDQFLDELTKTLNDKYKLILLDPTASPLVTAMQNEGLITPSTRVLSNAKEAALGTGFISCLPAFTTAPMDEIMNLRSDLDEPLSQYRADVAALRGEMTVGPFDADVQADILVAWRTRVEPEIQEIRSAMADHGLVREIVQAVDGDIRGLANGTWAPVMIGMLIADKTDMSGAIATGIGALATAGIMARTVTRERARARKDLASHDFYYLYRADEALRSLE